MSDLKIWTDKTDYVVARDAVEARIKVCNDSGLEEEVGALDKWRSIPDNEPFPWRGEECAPPVMMPAHEAVERLVKENGGITPFYFGSTEW